MSEIRAEVGASSFISLVGNGIRVLVSLASTILVSRWLGATDFGDASLIISSIAFFYYLLACGFDHTLPYFVSSLLGDGRYQEARRSLSVALCCSVVASLVTGLIVAITLPSILHAAAKSYLIWPTLIFIAQMPFGALANIFSGFLRGEKRFGPGIIKDQILIPTGTLVGAMIFVKALDQGVAGFGLAQLMGFLGGFIYITYVFFRTPRLKVAQPASQEKDSRRALSNTEMVRFSFPVGLANAIEPLVIHSSVIIGGLLFAASDIGRFSASLRIAFFAQFFLQSIAPIFSPYISELYHRGALSELRTLHHNVQFWCAKWAIFFGFAALIAGEYMIMPLGNDFKGSEGILIGLTVACMIEGTLGGSRQTLLMIGRSFLNLINFVLAALLNISLSYILSQRFGMTGLIAAFTITLLVLNTLRSAQLWWLTGIYPLAKNQSIYLICSLAIGLTLAAGLHSLEASPPKKAILVLLLLSGVLTALFWRDRDLLRKALRRGR